MDFHFSPEEERLRQDIREFAERELPPDWAMIDGEYSTEEAWQFTQAMSKKLAARGWLTMAWPKQYGGRGVSHIEQAIYRETAAYYEIPGTEMGVMGVAIVGPSLMLFGSEEQKREHLPRIAAGERYWCTGYSEPGAGSDLASLQTRAVEDGDDFVINGQKVWTSAGHRAHWCWLAARTDPQVPKHKGISLFLVNMKSPGITVRPLINVVGRHDFNEVFFENVRVPKRNLVGQKNRGWYYVAVALDFERSGVDRPARCRRALERLMDYCQESKPSGKSGAEASLVRHRLAEMALEIEVSRLLCYRVAWMQGKKLLPNYEVSMSKLYGSELMQRLAQLGMAILGEYGQLDHSSKYAALQGSLKNLYLHCLSETIAAGTSEIQRNVIATRGLGLPRV